jgi:predicted GNAT superfamily acetyltransferase
VLNQYGLSSSRLQGGLPTDRCIAEWWLASPRVEAILSGRTPERAAVAARIAVPSDIETIKQTDLPRAREIQKRVSNQFLDSFSKGLVVTGYERTSETGTYLLTTWDSK